MNSFTAFARRGIYLADAAGCLSLGLVLFVFAAPLAVLVGPVLTETILAGIGVFLIGYAPFNLWIGTRQAFPRLASLFNILGDVLWVAGSLAVLAAGGLAASGFMLVAALTVSVAAVGIVKGAGFRAALSLS